MQEFCGLKTQVPHFKCHHEVLFYCFNCSLQRFNDVESNKPPVLKQFIRLWWWWIWWIAGNNCDLMG